MLCLSHLSKYFICWMDYHKITLHSLSTMNPHGSDLQYDFDLSGVSLRGSQIFNLYSKDEV